MFSEFKPFIINTSKIKINLIKGGQGFPVLLLHGYPQTHIIWHKIAPKLAENFTVIVTDLRGYGDSDKPPGNPEHSHYSKRIMAQDQVEVMTQLGYNQFYLIGHDRGARVAHRLTLDYPDKVKKIVLLDIAPTYEMYTLTDQEFATAYYHWFFLIQPFPFPETLIKQNPDYFLTHCLQSWSKNDFTFTFTSAAIQEYLRCFRDPKTIHGTCEDYRASATIDLEHDQADIEQKIQCPLLVLWGKQGIIERKYNVLDSWKKRAINVQGKPINCGHFLPEEAPEETYQSIRDFL
ncbi:alpha/beta fold hydrolase [Aphanothece sacrum]|uniref:Alpha/beta hydrolase n=1 Tax=Aphanothece sacrum FPU1 TaxID=1920663 RepID=A0A401IBS5_APHSA|nr:alpha/beta hydrolase [Aphanothece sacrum]GBF78699.1 alpha/beta hydrolase [Aphanothece sacrum FPU1]GBF84988.1 alpha/beta hydrolase [Aphanothece sacrum FPU3]